MSIAAAEMNMSGLVLSEATLDHCEEISKLESIAFPSDEAASPEAIRQRLSEAGKFFYIYRLQSELVGFINGTCISTSSIHHDSMSTHDPNGSTLVIHSVTIDPKLHRKGLGTRMLKEYIPRIAKLVEIKQILLMAKAHMLSFYVDCGFSLVGLSNVEHGAVRSFTCSSVLEVLEAVLNSMLSFNEFNVLYAGSLV
jgi:ribosomal protein S18 acetylase RimI-like enzyme